MSDWVEREEQHLADMLANDAISVEEYNAELRALHREAREAAEEAAQGAYDREMDDRGYGRW